MTCRIKVRPILLTLLYLSRTEKHSGQAKLEVTVIQSQSFEQGLQKYIFTFSDTAI